MSNNNRIKYLERKVAKAGILETNYDAMFAAESRYMGNGMYAWMGQFACSPR
jgi:hypothetical protein